jgi:hypothetical protein
VKFPVTYLIRGIAVEVDSWEDLDEIIQRFGIDAPPIIARDDIQEEERRLP